MFFSARALSNAENWNALSNVPHFGHHCGVQQFPSSLVKYSQPITIIIPTLIGSGTFARLMPLAAAKESRAARSAADTADLMLPHYSGSMWLAGPSSCDSFIHYSLPVFPAH